MRVYELSKILNVPNKEIIKEQNEKIEKLENGNKEKENIIEFLSK